MGPTYLVDILDAEKQLPARKSLGLVLTLLKNSSTCVYLRQDLSISPRKSVRESVRESVPSLVVGISSCVQAGNEWAEMTEVCHAARVLGPFAPSQTGRPETVRSTRSGQYRSLRLAADSSHVGGSWQ